MTEEVYSNPVAPPGAHTGGDPHTDDDRKPLRNEDFRKMLLETPRIPTKDLIAHAQRSSKLEKKGPESSSSVKATGDNDAAARRMKRKSYYAKLKKEEDDRAKELASKYRDRARERRDGGDNPDYNKQDEHISTTADYRAVAPDSKVGADAAERRRQIIQESKFLGGDMEHTHLVKGLDYALLEKVRSEICSKEEGDDELENVIKKEKPEEDKEVIECKSQLARNITKLLFEGDASDKNELFLAGRMAYRIDMDDEYADTDIPSTVIRSKADLPNTEIQATLSTNDIVINKLTQILAYLRQGVRGKKSKKRDKGKMKEEVKRVAAAEENIYDDVGDYLPRLKADASEKGRDSRRDRDGGRSKDRYRERGRERDGGDRKGRGGGGGYFQFEKPDDGDREETDKDRQDGVRQFIKTVNERYMGAAADVSKPTAGLRATEDDVDKKKKEEKLRRLIQPSGYEECYPGAMAAEDAVVDSDDEADYSKMDAGNKKGAIGRWDFDTPEEYSNYMANKEALPKAAFQYGVKMSDGRKTRGRIKDGHKDEKAELDREWQKIQKIIAKRQGDGDGGSQHKRSKPH